MARFKKGESGNPEGRPVGTGIKPLLEAIRYVEDKKRIRYWEKVVEKSLTNPTIMVAILKKLVPESKREAVDQMQDSNWKIVFPRS